MINTFLTFKDAYNEELRLNTAFIMSYRQQGRFIQIIMKNGNEFQVETTLKAMDQTITEIYGFFKPVIVENINEI